MTCANCGAEAKSGRICGVFRFEPSPSARPAARNNRADHRAILEARAKYCPKCCWMGIDCATLVRHRRLRGARPPIPNEAGACPECGREAERGLVQGRFYFRADDRPSKSLWHELLASLPDVAAEADAQYCRCSWIGIDCSTFVAPGRIDTAAVPDAE